MTTPLCILVVDDAEFFLNLGKQFLRNTPATVVTATSGQTALEKAKELIPSLVYMDIDMPEMNGIECCRRFKSDPGLRNIPLILIGNRDRPELKLDVEQSGCDGYLEKPIDRRQFLNLGHSFLYSIDRREPRKDANITVTMTCHGAVHKANAIDISSGGMFVASTIDAREGDAVLMQFQLPGQEQGMLSLKGRVAWVNTAGHGRKPDYPDGYGIEFVDIPDTTGVMLRRYIDRP